MDKKDLFASDRVIVDTGKICLYSVCSPYPDHDVGFNWLNCDYPYLHQHNYWELIIITEGNIIHTINDKIINMTKGDAVLLRPNDCHKLNLHDPSDKPQHLSFLIKESYINDVFKLYSLDLSGKILSFPMPIMIRYPEDEIFEIVNYMLNFKSTKLSVDEKVYFIKIIVNKTINKIINYISVLPNNNSQWLSDFLFMLSNPYTDTSNVNKLAEKTPYSYANLTRIFKKTTGRTIVDYCNHIKIKHAKDLLRVTDLSVFEISIRLNFNNISYFNRLFKNHTGMSPTEYRNSVTNVK